MNNVIKPTSFLKSSVVLGKSLTCNVTCLSKLSNIAIQETAFGNPAKWSFGDVHDLGIIVSGKLFLLLTISLHRLQKHQMVEGRTPLMQGSSSF